jgi:ribosomal protein S18 acetylase RimI-like enzyme
MDAMSIRTAASADLGEVREVRRTSSLSNELDRPHLLANPEYLDFDGAPIEDGRTRVAVVAGHVVGFTSTGATDDGLELVDLFVEPDSMRNGIGRALVLDVVASARRDGFERINLTANEHALAFYESLGFVVNGVVETRFRPAPRMHLDLDPTV